MRAARRTLLAATLLLAAGCEAQPPVCAGFTGTHAFRYVGPAIGDGELTLARDDAGRLAGRITLHDDMGSGAQIDIEGPAECDGAGVRVRFGPGDHPQAAYRVVGGTFVMTRDPVAFDWFFGAWSATVVFKATGESRALRGFLRERTVDAEEDAAPL